VPLFPIFLIFFIGSVAETNRAPFDLAEAESELVSGFMTEHSAVIFVFFFLAEYASIVLMCILISILYLGGYNIDLYLLNYIIEFVYENIVDALIIIVAIFDYLIQYYNIFNQEITHIYYDSSSEITGIYVENFLNEPIIENIFYALIIGFKTFIMIFVFI
jgi:NADH-ubiquinone oxidoreductase chain 1